MTTSPVMTVTDELLAELEELAAGATEGPWKYEIDEDSCYGAVFVKPDTEHYSPPICRIDHNVTAEFVAATDPMTIMVITAELRRLRAENAELGGLLREAGKTIHKVQAEQPTPLRIARYLDAMRAKIDTAMATQ